MIVDVHTHIWESPEQLGRGSSRRILRAVDQPWDRPDASSSAHDDAMSPVTRAFILGFESAHLGASIPAQQVAGYVARHPEKYLGFAGIDPLADGYLKKVDEAKQLGMVGVTVSPSAQGFHPAHSRAMRLYEKCEALGFPVLVHPVTHLSAEAKLEFSQPYFFDEIARAFPKLKLVIAQVGYPWVDQTLVLLGKHENVFADISDVVSRPWQLYNVLHSAHSLHVIDRLLFGSDFPFCTPQKAITTIYSVNTLTAGTPLPSVPREQLRSIVERDVFTCLGLKKKQRDGDEKKGDGDEATKEKAEKIAKTTAEPVVMSEPKPVKKSAGVPSAAAIAAAMAQEDDEGDENGSTVLAGGETADEGGGDNGKAAAVAEAATTTEARTEDDADADTMNEAPAVPTSVKHVVSPTTPAIAADEEDDGGRDDEIDAETAAAPEFESPPTAEQQHDDGEDTIDEDEIAPAKASDADDDEVEVESPVGEEFAISAIAHALRDRPAADADDDRDAHDEDDGDDRRAETDAAPAFTNVADDEDDSIEGTTIIDTDAVSDDEDDDSLDDDDDQSNNRKTT